MIVPEASRHLIAGRANLSADSIIGLDDGTTVTVGPFEAIGIPSAHERLERDEKGHCRYLGYLVLFGPWAIYHSGDTVLYDGLVERLRAYSIDIALLPINGRGKGVPGNLNAQEAVWLAKEASVRCVIPCHYDMFAFNTGSAEDFREAAQSAGIRYQLIRCGDRYTNSSLGR